MCVAVPCRVVEVPDGGTAVVSRRGVTSTVSLLAAEARVQPGDWVLVHSGFVLGHLTDDDVHQLVDMAGDGGPA